MNTSWKARVEPLEVVAVAAMGGVARELARRLLKRDEDELRRLRGVTWPDGLALEGAFNELPWADGAMYFGRVGGFLLPSNLEPDVPFELWTRALRQSLGDKLAPPMLVLPGVHVVVSLAEARAVKRAKLEAWLNL